MTEPLLMLMDYQETICRTDGVVGRTGVGAEVVRRGALAAAGRALRFFRQRHARILHTRVAFDPGYERLTSASPRFQQIKSLGLFLESDPGTRFCVEVAPLPGEIVITKGCVNPFVGTPLLQALITAAPSELVLGGVVTNHVVESAAMFAADNGYRVVVLEDLCASFTPELHDFAVRNVLPAYARLVTSADYIASWQ